jgi:DNA topoisomerase I
MSTSETGAGPQHRITAARARAVGLRHLPDDRPGIRRRRSGRGFAYRDTSGEPIRNASTLRRIRALAVPPNWTEVWISPEPDAHLLATGRDARGRKVYRYHPRFRGVMDRVKFGRLVQFGRLLPRIRRRVDGDLRRHGLARDTVAAAVVGLLERALIRVGNDEYARANRSIGLTTLRNRHVTVDGATIRFRFRGKSGRQHEVEVRDRRLATVIGRCSRLPGAALFRYLDDDGRPHRVTSRTVNDYLREAAGADVSAKDFRTWFATVLAYRVLRDAGRPIGERQAKRQTTGAIAAVAERLGNTPRIARASYVHPAVVDAYQEELIPEPGRATRRGTRRSPPNPAPAAPPDADPEATDPTSVTRRDELRVLELLAPASGS